MTQWPQPGTGPQWYLPSYPVPPPPPPPPPARRGYLIGLVIGAVALVVVCAGVAVTGLVWLGRPHTVAGEDPSPAFTADNPGAAAAPTPADTSSATAEATPDGSARRYLLDPPAGATLVPSGDGVLTVAQVGGDTANYRDSETELLNNGGFVGGGTRSWVTAAGITVLIDLLQFDTAAHASAYLSAEKAAVAPDFTPQTTRTIPGVPQGVTYVGVGDYQFTSGRTFSYAVKRNLVLFVRTSDDGDQLSTAVADDTAARQYKRM
jgi:hypothetical protein